METHTMTIDDALCEISELSAESIADELECAAGSETMTDAIANLLEAVKAARKLAKECEALAKRLGKACE
jgi:hypothetical protein